MSPAPDEGVPTPRVDVPKEKLAAFCERWGVAEVALFGSVLRDDFKPDSDVDVLVKFHAGRHPSLFGFARMESELSEHVGHRVELVERNAIERSPNYIRREAILRSARTIYASDVA